MNGISMMQFDYIMAERRPCPVGLVTLDVDPQSSRFCLVDRQTLNPVYMSKDKGNVSRIVPIEYSAEPSLLVLMLDDAGQFNAVCNDAVQAEFVDANTLAV